MKTPTSGRRFRTWFPLTLTMSLLAATGVALLLGARTSVMNSANRAASSRSLPAGQFQADARTVVAAISFLLDHRPDLPAATTAGSGGSNELALQSWTASNSLCCLSNPAAASLEPTNTPARG
jgi:hypothetical protein